MYEALKIVRFQYNFCYCSINLGNYKIVDFFGFQYNFCYCSICCCCKSCYCYGVSIQLLLLFYTEGFFINISLPVSIQLLLLFYKSRAYDLHWVILVSIQLLLLFYIKAILPNIYNKRFNTTFVTVLFNSACASKLDAFKFQYNFCYCSIV